MLVLKSLILTCHGQVTVPARVRLVLRHFHLKGVSQTCLHIDLLEDLLLLTILSMVNRAVVRDVGSRVA